MGYKLWSVGELASSADVNTYLMKQTIIVCTSGTRPASPPEGMHIYETDTDRLLKYTGAAWEIVAGSRASHTPSLTATTTNPIPGSGSKLTGHYTYLPGPSIAFSFFIKFGTSGVTAGSGQYLISLPVSAANAHTGDQPAMGSANLRDDSAGSVQMGATYIPGSNLAVCSIIYAGGGVVGSSTPWTWAANDYLAGTIVYPV